MCATVGDYISIYGITVANECSSWFAGFDWLHTHSKLFDDMRRWDIRKDSARASTFGQHDSCTSSLLIELLGKNVLQAIEILQVVMTG